MPGVSCGRRRVKDGWLGAVYFFWGFDQQGDVAPGRWRGSGGRRGVSLGPCHRRAGRFLALSNGSGPSCLAQKCQGLCGAAPEARCRNRHQRHGPSLTGCEARARRHIMEQALRAKNSAMRRKPSAAISDASWSKTPSSLHLACAQHCAAPARGLGQAVVADAASDLRDTNDVGKEGLGTPAHPTEAHPTGAHPTGPHPTGAHRTGAQT